MARRSCSGCHSFPEPSVLPRSSWPHVLDYMALLMGAPVRPNAHADIARLRADLARAKLLPEKPMIAPEDFTRLRAYYEQASEAKLSASGRSSVESGETATHLFEPRRTAFHRERPTITLLATLPGGRGLLAADALSRTVARLSADGAVLQEDRLPGPPSAVVFEGPATWHFSLLYLADPSPRTEAAVATLSGGRSHLRSTGLPRLAHLLSADLDGRPGAELYASGFGLFTGGLYVVPTRSAAGAHAWRSQLLADGPGWLGSQAYDWNGDGVSDLIVLRGQAREGLYWIDGRDIRSFARGDSRTRTAPSLRPILEHHPAFGYVSFSIVLRSAGAPIVVLVNGDNGDLHDTPRKPYHGIRLYEARAAPKELAFLPMPGAYQAELADFDGDGDLDVAAIAFYPDYDQQGRSFVFFENLGDFRFRRRTVLEAENGRWIRMASGDFDGDGDLDLALGSYVVPALPMPAAERQRLERRGHTVLLLENRAPRKNSAAGR